MYKNFIKLIENCDDTNPSMRGCWYKLLVKIAVFSGVRLPQISNHLTFPKQASAYQLLPCSWFEKYEQLSFIYSCSCPLSFLISHNKLDGLITYRQQSQLQIWVFMASFCIFLETLATFHVSGRSATKCLRNLKTKTNSAIWVRERTIPTERPPLVGEVSANFCG
jgi:hypothetical protein